MTKSRLAVNKRHCLASFIINIFSLFDKLHHGPRMHLRNSYHHCRIRKIEFISTRSIKGAIFKHLISAQETTKWLPKICHTFQFAVCASSLWINFIAKTLGLNLWCHMVLPTVTSETNSNVQKLVIWSLEGMKP